MYTGGVSGSCWALGGAYFLERDPFWSVVTERSRFLRSVLHVGGVFDEESAGALCETLNAVRFYLRPLVSSTILADLVIFWCAATR